MQVHKATTAGEPQNIMSREDFDLMDVVAGQGARDFINEAKRLNIHFGKVSAFSFAVEQNAISYYHYFEKPKDLQVQLDLINEVEALRAALTLVQSRLVLTDNDSLKSVIEDALSKHNPKVNSKDLAKEIAEIKSKAANAKAERIDKD